MTRSALVARRPLCHADAVSGPVGAFLLTLTSLVPIMNPIAVLPIFGAFTEGLDAAGRNRTARRTALAVLVVTVLSAAAGRFVLQLLGISLAGLQVAGGIVVGASALAMIGGRMPGLNPEEHAEQGNASDPSVVPLAIPLISGPGAIGVLIAIASREAAPLPIVGVVAACAVMAALIWVVLRFGEPLLQRLGTTGIGVLVRLFGLAVLAVAVELVARGATQLFPALH